MKWAIVEFVTGLTIHTWITPAEEYWLRVKRRLGNAKVKDYKIVKGVEYA